MVVLVLLILLLSIAIIEVSEGKLRGNVRFRLLIKFDLSKLNWNHGAGHLFWELCLETGCWRSLNCDCVSPLDRWLSVHLSVCLQVSVVGGVACLLQHTELFYLRNRKHVPFKFGRMRNAVGTRATGECFHSFFEFSQTFTSVSVTR